ncbi:uncharacterized protein LOC143181925 [Calliopsis andreniformis]|uniref:uncharacterized protein LOC143181925 n=1 Tax=Calliopsis andreniformis TaxID=337506 RepID=UPI003FCE8006
MIHVPDISKDFILNKAVRDATHILLKPYMPILSESRQSANIFDSNYKMINEITQGWVSNSQDFLLQMATIAWDFLNVLSIFPSNIPIRNIQEIDERLETSDEY